MVKILYLKFYDEPVVEFPECPYADLENSSNGICPDFNCKHPNAIFSGCGTHNFLKNKCPFNLHEELYGTTNNKDGE